MFDNAQYRKLLLVNWVSEIFLNTKRVTKRGMTLCLTVSMEIYFMILLHDMQNKFFFFLTQKKKSKTSFLSQKPLIFNLMILIVHYIVLLFLN